MISQLITGMPQLGISTQVGSIANDASTYLPIYKDLPT